MDFTPKKNANLPIKPTEFGTLKKHNTLVASGFLYINPQTCIAVACAP